MSGEKTEAPSAKRRRDSRMKGDVPHSRDVTQAVMLIGLLTAVAMMSDFFLRRWARLFIDAGLLAQVPLREAWPAALQLAGEALLGSLIPVLTVVLGLGLAIEFVQVGPLLAWQKLKPSLGKLNMLSNAKNMFSKKNLVEFLKSVVKVAVMGGLVAWVIMSALADVLGMPWGGLSHTSMVVGAMLRQLALTAAATWAVIAMVDMVWQRHQFTKGIMMSKDEVRREHKDSDGNPQIKHKRKHLHQENMADTPKTSVLVTNPTHLAVGVFYDPGARDLPRITIKARGDHARRLQAAARRLGVPIVRDIGLARALMATTQIGDPVPSLLFESVADVLRQVTPRVASTEMTI